MRTSALALLAAGVLTAVAVVAGVLTRGGGGDGGGDGASTAKPPAPTSTPFHTTPLKDYDTTTAMVTRGPFCDRVDGRQVQAAIGATPTPTEWGNGETSDVIGGQKADVVQEYGCRYAVPAGATAQAWVFAPPVGVDEATSLIDRAKKAAGCQVGSGPAFGSPSLALTCTAQDGTIRASYRGLFGDAWLVCELDLPSTTTADVADATGRWCVGVLQALTG